MPLDPQAEQFLKQLEAANVPQFHQLTLEDARALAVPVPGPHAPVANVADRTIAGLESDIPVRIYTPREVDRSRPQDDCPALVYFHGGGWVIGTLDAYDGLCRALAQASGCVVVSVDYRLAPEHKYPAAVDDAYAVTKWVAENAQKLAVEPSRIAVGGDSAGGNLAAAVCLMAKDRGGPRVAYQVLIYPITDCSFDTPSYRQNGDGYFLTKPTMEWFWQQYLSDESDGRQPYASPLQAPDLSGMPPAFVLTAEYDPLHDEGEAYARRLQEADVPVTLSRCEGMIHGFVRRTDVFDRAKASVEEIGRALRSV